MSYKKIIRSNWRRSKESRADYLHEIRKESFFMGRRYSGPVRWAYKWPRRKPHYMKGNGYESRTKENRTAFNRRDRRKTRQEVRP